MALYCPLPPCAGSTVLTARSRSYLHHSPPKPLSISTGTECQKGGRAACSLSTCTFLDPLKRLQTISAPGIPFCRLFVDTSSPQQSYMELSNPADEAVDISGWELQGAVQFTFEPGEWIGGVA